MANWCEIRMRIAGRTAEGIENFVEDIRRHGKFRAYNGVFTEDEPYNPDKLQKVGQAYCYDAAFGCKWSFVSSFEEDGVGRLFGSGPNFDLYLHDYCAKHGVGVEAYSEEPGNGFEEHYVISPNGDIAVADVSDMKEVEDETTESGWRKLGGFGDPAFMDPEDIINII